MKSDLAILGSGIMKFVINELLSRSWDAITNGGIGMSLEVKAELSRDPAKVDRSINARSLLFLPTFVVLRHLHAFLLTSKQLAQVVTIINLVAGRGKLKRRGHLKLRK